jgi:hypothetical protein
LRVGTYIIARRYMYRHVGKRGADDDCIDASAAHG